MPHLTLHYTANIEGFDPVAALREINRRLAGSGHFDEAAIKSRALRLDHYRVGVAEKGRGFLHAQLRILHGRDADTRAALSNLVLDALETTLPRPHPDTQLCVEVDEMDVRSYSKRVFDAQSD